METFYEFIEEYNLMVIKWVGPWDMKDYMASIDEFSKKTQNYDIQKVIQDITDIADEVTDEVISELVTIRKEKIKHNYKVVYITNKPNHVVFSELYAYALPNKNSHHYCTTFKSALDILSVYLTEKELKKMISFY